MSRRTTSSFICAAAVAGVLGPGSGAAAEEGFDAALRALLLQSMDQHIGLTFHLHGEEIGGAVVRLIGDDAVEIRNQSYGHIVIRLEKVDAVAAN
ncbi:MAG: hypothetical protein IT495_17270 [Gammaproteobacteria bacterium]|nr:hypothetical protein [Gammaproteobacteria bacterium]